MMESRPKQPPRYQWPPLDELLAFGDTFESDYKRITKEEGKSQNPQHLDYIRYYKTFVELIRKQYVMHTPIKNESEENEFGFALVTRRRDYEAAESALVSFLVAKLATIERAYEGKSPLLKKGRLVTTGSVLYTLIYRKLNISPNQNPLNDKEYIIYIGRYYANVKKDRWQIFPAYMKDKSELIKEIEDNQKWIIVTKQSEELKQLLVVLPSSEALAKSLNALEKKYEDNSKERFYENQFRKKQIALINLVNRTCDLLYKDNFFQGYIARLGILLFVAKSIKATYYRSPFNSELYTLIMRILHANRISHISIERQNMWLERGLLQHMNHLLDLSETREHSHIISNDMKKFFLESKAALHSQLHDVTLAEIHLPSKIESAIANAAYCGIHLTIGKALPFVAGAALTTGVVEAGIIGVFVFGAVGGLVATQLTEFLQAKLIDEVTATVFTKLAEKIGRTIGGACSFAIEMSTTGLQKLLGFYEKQIDREALLADREWISALRQLTILPPDERQILQEIDLNPHPERLRITKG